MMDLLNIIPDLSFEQIIKYLFGFICHLDKSILFKLGDNFIPLCPSCLGLHAGFFITLIVIKLFFQKPINLNEPRNMFFISVSITLAGIHWLLGFLGIIEINIASRLITGLVSGAGFCLLLNSLKYKYFQSEFYISYNYKSVLAYSFVLLLCISLLGDYNLLILIILLLVTNNIISIINSIWLIIRKNKIYHSSLEIKKEMQL